MTATIDHALASASGYVHVEVSCVETSKELATGKTVELDTGRDPLPMINFDNKREDRVKLWKFTCRWIDHMVSHCCGPEVERTDLALQLAITTSDGI